MKKLILTTVVAGLFVVKSFGLSTSITVLPANMTNAFAFINGSVQVQQIVVTAPGVSNTAVSLIDTPTNALVYTNAPYTNTISYVTNLITANTDYYNNVWYTTNYALIDVTNNLVPGNTNNYPVRVSMAALAGTSVVADSVNYYFNRGLWITNTSSGSAIVTITYRQ